MTTTTTTSPADKEIPLSNMQPAAAHPNPNLSGHPNADLETGLLATPEPALTRESSASLEAPPPDYKEHDMPEPLPPYMTRVRGVMRRQQPLGAAMPVMERRTGFWIIGTFALVVLIVIGVGVGVRAANYSSPTTTTSAPPPPP